MIYKDHEIIACVQRSELWTVDDTGKIQKRLGVCPTHDDYSVVYHVRDGSGQRPLVEILGFEDAKSWIDAKIVYDSNKQRHPRL